MEFSETIFSLVTKPINQNVGVIRVSGPRTFEILKKIFPNIEIKKNSYTFKKFYFKKQFIDDVIVLFFLKPNSFTGEDSFEIQFHGSMFIVRKIINILESFDIRQSLPGEFTKQAFINGKISLSQSESINTIILSENQYLTELASKNLNGFQNEFILNVKKKIENFISRIQVSIDYPENTDLPKYNINSLKEDISKEIISLEKIIEDSQKILNISEGIKISIIGPPNVGKSSLFNILSNEDKAIISNIKGTTRDVIESHVYFNGIKVIFLDTAGIRKKTRNKIESMGINKSNEILEKSDIIIFVLSSDRNIKNQELNFSKILEGKENKIIKVINKTDKSKIKYKNGISVKDKKIYFLEKEIMKKINDNFYNEKEATPLFINDNQVKNFNEILSIFKNVVKMIEEKYTDDFIFFELEKIIKLIYKIEGKEIDADYFYNIFKNFCVGK